MLKARRCRGGPAADDALAILTAQLGPPPRHRCGLLSVCVADGPQQSGVTGEANISQLRGADVIVGGPDAEDEQRRRGGCPGQSVTREDHRQSLVEQPDEPLLLTVVLDYRPAGGERGGPGGQQFVPVVCYLRASSKPPSRFLTPSTIRS